MSNHERALVVEWFCFSLQSHVNFLALGPLGIRWRIRGGFPGSESLGVSGVEAATPSPQQRVQAAARKKPYLE